MIKNKLKRFFAVLMIVMLLGSLLPPMVGAAEADFDNLIVGSAKKPSEGGALQIVDSGGQMTLGDKNGNPIQLRGMSTHGLQWFPGILNENAFSALANDWDSNAIRLAMYVGEDGYATSPDVIKQRVIDGIELAKANNMYVIVDWHVHAPGDPNADVYSGAMDFFEDISTLYPNDPNIIYELANEPSSNSNGGPGLTNDAAGWQAVKDYAQPIVNMLRDNGNENLIIVGSPNWSQRPDLAADNPIEDDNTIYTVHFYSGTHAPASDSTDRENVMSNARYALENGLALFSSEWGTSEASGNNGPFLDEADVWLDFLNENNISWTNWSLTNKNETSASFMPFELRKQAATDLDPGDDQVWAPEELSVSGEYVRARIKGISYEPIDRTPREDYSDVIWDFEDGTTQGFGQNADSPNEITVTNENNALQISGLNTSNDVSEGNYWANARLSADSWGTSIDVLGAEQLTMDVIVDEPTTVSIAAIPQGPSAGWANPTRAIQVTPDDFVDQGDGTYKAVLTISKADSPSLETIASSPDDNTMNNIVLFVGTENANVVSLDNISVSGNRLVPENPIVHAELGEATLPSDFENDTRQGWVWHAESGVKNALTIEEANGSKALSWDFAYPEVKPSDDWASAPRLDFWKDDLTRGDNDYVTFDLYLDPVRASEGAISINLTTQPPDAGYWAQASDTFEIDLTALDSASQTDSGLYHYEVKIDLNTITSIEDATQLRNMILIFADVESDFAGRAFVDNVSFESKPVQVVTKPEVVSGKVILNTDDINNVKDSGELVVDVQEEDQVQVDLTAEQVQLLKDKGVKITIKNKETTVTIPSVNLPDGDVSINVTEVTDITDSENAVSFIVDLTINNGDTIEFDEPVILTFRVDTSKVDDTENLEVRYYNKVTGKWETVGGTYEDSFITVEINHFSIYGVFEANTTTDPGDGTTDPGDGTTDPGDGTTDPGDGTNDPEDDSGEDDDNPDVVDVDKDKDSDDDKDLPATSTSMFNWLAIGLIILLAGTILAFYVRRKRLLE
ncbi:cellulase family glycosylhydrolase [Aquibacillus halophilus]|uniref:cellulase n=1 Tax=Aquibacillus halophilus TaxID=930132 RepID=A0A6A8DF97_9BACI|nr:carbohydrate-binding domain-containing protein [Aquibacillus halophilus]MRH44333.1 cellulase family glycosylhydrolase [Aquibacillus halophilus]